MAGKSETREYTLNLHKALHKRHLTFKKRAPRAIKYIKDFAMKVTGTTKAKVDVELNKAVWMKGIKAVPTRLRIRITKKRDDDEESDGTYVAHATVAEKQEFRGLGVTVVEEGDA